MTLQNKTTSVCVVKETVFLPPPSYHWELLRDTRVYTTQLVGAKWLIPVSNGSSQTQGSFVVCWIEEKGGKDGGLERCRCCNLLAGREQRGAFIYNNNYAGTLNSLAHTHPLKHNDKKNCHNRENEIKREISRHTVEGGGNINSVTFTQLLQYESTQLLSHENI